MNKDKKEITKSWRSVKFKLAHLNKAINGCLNSINMHKSSFDFRHYAFKVLYWNS